MYSLFRASLLYALTESVVTRAKCVTTVARAIRTVAVVRQAPFITEILALIHVPNMPIFTP